MPTPVIVDTIRTPIGALGGALARVRPDDMAALVLKTILESNKLDPALVDEVILGCANQAGEDNRNVARMSLLLAGFPPVCRESRSTGCAHQGWLRSTSQREPSGRVKGTSSSLAESNRCRVHRIPCPRLRKVLVSAT